MDSVFWIEKDKIIENLNSFDAIKDIDNALIPPLVPIERTKLKNVGLFSDILDSELENTLIDNLNKLYVALTRPKEELHVFMCIGKKENPTKKLNVKKVSKCSHLLLKYVPKLVINGETMKVSERDLDTCYTQGDDSAEGNKLHTFTYYLGEINTNADKEEKSDVLSVRDYWVSSEVLPVHVSLHNTSGTLKDEGLKMHALFSMIKGERDFDKAFNYAKNNGLLSDNMYWTEGRVRQLFESIKASEQLMTWFDDDNICYNERSISFQLHDTIDHRRPDRIVKRANGEMLIIDYKFGYSDKEETMAMHKRQVHDYMILMSKLGETNIKGYVWYARSGKIVEVEP